MKKLHMLFALLFVLLSPAALAAPVGWYDYSATWRDGKFIGQFYYDSSATSRITAVKGTLEDLAQTTEINQIYYLDYDEPAPWNFLGNSDPDELGGHDAGFYLTLLDLGASLTLDTSGANGLYDWSDEVYYHPGQLDDSPLISFSITEASAVPEPGTALLLSLGFAGLLGLRRVRSRQA